MAENLAFHDKFAAFLGATVLEVRPGYARASLVIKEDFLNGAGLAHGGVIFFLADYAFALAANGGERMGLAISSHIDFIKSARAGEEITAEVTGVAASRRLGNFQGRVTNQAGDVLAQFQSVAYFKTGA